jgi:hypothetical protein
LEEIVMREHEDEREPAGRPPQASGTTGRPGASGKRRDPGDDWADQAAKARTGDDARAAAPHDSAGVPTTGSTTGRPEHR